MEQTSLSYVSHYYDLEQQGDCIKLEYILETPGYPARQKIDWISAKPVGDWTTIQFEKHEKMSVDRFLNTMVVKNNEVLRKMCILLLKKIGWNYHEYMYLVPILDPTFDPPRINPHCLWQREFANSLVQEHFFGVIATCRNNRRLDELYQELFKITNNQ